MTEQLTLRLLLKKTFFKQQSDTISGLSVPTELGLSARGPSFAPPLIRSILIISKKAP